MPITQTMTFSATPPTTGETPSVFNFNAISCWSELKLTTVPNLNTAFEQMNALETNVSTKEASTVYSADIATTAANYQGDYVSQGYTKGQSVSSGGTTYMCKLTHTTPFPVDNTTYWQPTGYAAIVNGATAMTTPIDNDIIGIGDSVASFALKKLTWANIKATILSSFGVMISTSTAKTVPVDADIFIIGDSAATNASKKTTWANIKTTLGLLFAPLISPAFTGTPTAPTAVDGTNTIQVATTAFVKAKSELDSIGVGQTWAAVTRTNGVTYTNTTGKPILWYIAVGSTVIGSFTPTISGLATTGINASTGNSGAVSFIIPNGATYSFTGTASAVHYELR